MRVSFAENPLKTVEINFSLLPFLVELDFNNALCMNAEARNSTEIEDVQQQIQHNCTLH